MKNQFTSRIVKFTFALMFVLIASSCSQDDEAMDAAVFAKEINSEIAARPGKFAATVAAGTFNLPAEVCAGVAAEFCLNFPQATKGNGDPKETNVQIQLLVDGDDPDTLAEETEYFMQIGQANENVQYCFNYEFAISGEYKLRYKIGGAGSETWTDVTVIVADCTPCVESFSYDSNGGGSYTFKYKPAEDMVNALLVFTFPQGTYDSGLDDWATPGVTMQKTMNLVACQTYEWTVVLKSNCKGTFGAQDKGNVFTDFTVNDVSRKGNVDKIEMPCTPE